jgi:hypothetical protein
VENWVGNFLMSFAKSFERGSVYDSITLSRSHSMCDWITDSIRALFASENLHDGELS